MFGKFQKSYFLIFMAVPSSRMMLVSNICSLKSGREDLMKSLDMGLSKNWEAQNHNTLVILCYS